MKTFQLHTVETAPEASIETLQILTKKLGFIPNLYGVLAESPESALSYFKLTGLVEQGKLTLGETEIVALVVSVENNCSYCVAVHSYLARIYKIEEDSIIASRAGKNGSNSKLNALANFTRAVVRERGNAGETKINEFLAAGYTKQQALEVVMSVATTTLSNYTNRLADTPLDAAFAGDKWI